MRSKNKGIIGPDGAVIATSSIVPKAPSGQLVAVFGEHFHSPLLHSAYVSTTSAQTPDTHSPKSRALFPMRSTDASKAPNMTSTSNCG